MSAAGAAAASGAPGGMLVIALHGAVANGATWLPLARVLEPTYELWMPDLPGHGAFRNVPFTLADSLAAIAELVERAAPRRPILAGDSLGGYLALAAAARLGDAIGGVVAGGCTWSMHGFGGWLARASDLPPRALERLLGTARIEGFANALVPHVTDAITACAIVAGGLRARARSESLRELAGMDLVPLVRAITVPVVFINGRFDWPTRAGERALRAAARDGSLVLGSSGHGVGIFDAAAFARAIESAASRAFNAT